MKRQKDIFDLFRDNRHQFDEAPDAQVWRRLERRLDQHQRRGRIITLRSLSMAAGILLLVTVISSIALLMGRRPAADALADMPQQLEYLPQVEGDVTAMQVVEFRRTYHDRMNRPIEEGAPSKRLVPVEQ